MTKSLIFMSSMALLLSSCTSFETQLPALTEPPAKVYRESFNKVWRATQMALRKYPIKVNNMDAGILETDWIKTEKLFSNPLEVKNRPGTRYKITLRVVKGKLESTLATKVTCIKSVEVQRDFFSGFESVRSDGLEENLVLYRIGRFVDIDHILTKPEKPTTSATGNDSDQ